MIIHDEAVKKVLMDSGWSEEKRVEIDFFGAVWYNRDK